MAKNKYRLPTGGRIDRSRPICFEFNGKKIQGYAGDTLASALLANGVHFVGRSFKYHRPRGIFSHGADEPNALFQVDRGPGRADPNNRATMVEALEGLSIHSQNHWPSLSVDLGAINDFLSPLFASGFYYKTFMWPKSWWSRIYEPLIRAAAGLGVAPSEPDEDRYTHRYLHADILIVGAGPAGLAVALAASAGSGRVVLVDEQAELGGALLHDQKSVIEGLPAADWLENAISVLTARQNVIILRRTTAFGYYSHNHIAMLERVTDHLANGAVNLPRERLWQVRAKSVVLATGSHERPLCFADNDRPGILLAESIRAYINRYGVIPGKKIVFVTSGPSAYQAAEDAHHAGLAVTVVDVRPEALCRKDADHVHGQGIEVLSNHTILGSTGRRRVTGLLVAPLDANGKIGKQRKIACDCVGLSGGWTPAVHLFSQSRGRLEFKEETSAFVPGISTQALTSVGSCNGKYDLSECLQEGWRAGEKLADGVPRHTFSVYSPNSDGGVFRTLLPSPHKPSRVRAFIDLQNDVTAKDIALAVQEGFESVEHVKRYTTTGMATDQGKSSNMLALGLLADVRSLPIPEIGMTTFRPPYTPIPFGAIAGSAKGALFEPLRKAPLHEWAVARGAVFENVGLWARARYFPRPGEDMAAAVARECRAVRNQVGVFDASTLGKIEVVGPDAAEFMNRIYVNGWSKLAPGRCRYGLMLKENGYIFDDGVVARLAEDRFHVTTTTSGAPNVLAHMEDYLQTEWSDLNVFLTSTTEQWAVIAVQGPNSAKVLAPLISDVDLSDDAFPHMSVKVGHICGIPARIFRVSFTGERGYEINVPSGHAKTVWKAICHMGEGYGLAPYGTEAMHVLRAERGFIIIGQETDGTVTPDDVGLTGMIPKAKTDFVGKRSLLQPDLARTGRKQLVGLLPEPAHIVADEGAQVVPAPDMPIPMTSLGHVTSSYWSETCGRSIALGLVEDGRARKDTIVHLTTREGFVAARITDPVFYDALGARVNASS